jgi:chloramphenicol 3-O phosphotransferase
MWSPTSAITIRPSSPTAPVPEPVRRWQVAVHKPGIYDLEVDTTGSAPDACAEAIRRRIEAGGPPAAFRRLAAT